MTTSENKGSISQTELEANQQSIDAAVSAIDRISSTTQFSGRKLLDGSLDFRTSGLSRFDSSTATFTNVKVNAANFNANGDAITVAVTLTTAAARAAVTLTAAAAAADTTIEVTGNRGTVTLRVGTGQNFDAAINAVSDSTGVTATGTTVNSEGYGGNSFARIRNIANAAVAGSEASAVGTDAVGSINGQLFEADGLRAFLKNGALDVELTFATTAAAGASSFTITGGGAKFQIGAEINSSNQTNLGISSFSSSNLGSITASGDRTLSSIVTGGVNSLVSASVTSAASKARIGTDVVQAAIQQVSSTRARLGAFQAYTIDTNVNSLNVRLENLSAAKSAIVDTDFALETANLTRLQILQQAGTSALAIANSRPQSVLSLLGG